MKVINFLGGPSARKSTMAAATYVALKERGASVELVREYATYMILAGREQQLREDQLSVLAKQHHLLAILEGKVEFAVCDSPLVLNALYAAKDVPPSFETLVMDYFHRFENVNFLLDVDWSRWTHMNRIHSEVESRAKHDELQMLLERNRIPYTVLPLGPDRIQRIIEAVTPPSITRALNLAIA